MGSSPLTRGALQVEIDNGMVTGLIPAHAGSTRRFCFYFFASRAHPRSRGEHFLCMSSTFRSVGSSPLTRGARRRTFTGDRPNGLIPAHAGSTRMNRTVIQSWRAHPRSRGEHLTCTLVSDEVQGSSPLTRGARGLILPCFVCRGLIPAHAGSTVSFRAKAACTSAHPRSRGEHSCYSTYFLGFRAHPRSRGEHPPVTARPPHLFRLIPAHAGSTRARC